MKHSRANCSLIRRSRLCSIDARSRAFSQWHLQSLGFLSPIALDLWIDIIFYLILTSLSVTPIGTVYHFTKNSAGRQLHRVELSALTLVIHVGYVFLGLAGALSLTLLWSWLSFLLPPFLTLLSGWGLARREAAGKSHFSTSDPSGVSNSKTLLSTQQNRFPILVGGVARSGNEILAR